MVLYLVEPTKDRVPLHPIENFFVRPDVPEEEVDRAAEQHCLQASVSLRPVQIVRVRSQSRFHKLHTLFGGEGLVPGV